MRLNQRIIPCRSEDIFFLSSNRDTTIDDKHLKIISQWCLRHVIEKKKTFSSQKYPNKFDLHIVDEDKFYSRRDHFTISISNKFSIKPLNLRSERGPNYDMLSSTGRHHSMEWWNGRILAMRNTLLYETKVSQIWTTMKLENDSKLTGKSYLKEGQFNHYWSLGIDRQRNSEVLELASLSCRHHYYCYY